MFIESYFSGQVFIDFISDMKGNTKKNGPSFSPHKKIANSQAKDSQAKIQFKANVTATRSRSVSFPICGFSSSRLIAVKKKKKKLKDWQNQSCHLHYIQKRLLIITTSHNNRRKRHAMVGIMAKHTD